MKKLVIDGDEYELVDENARSRLTTAEGNIENLQTGKANSADVPSNVSDLENDAGFITQAPVEDVTIDGESIIQGITAVIPRATPNRAGVLKFDPNAHHADVYTSGKICSVCGAYDTLMKDGKCGICGSDASKFVEGAYHIPLLDSGNGMIAADQLPIATTSTQGAMSAADKAKLDGILGSVYPVGAVYISVTEVDPAALFGGTWAQIKDAFLFAAGDDESDWFALKADSDITANSLKVYMWQRTA